MPQISFHPKEIENLQSILRTEIVRCKEGLLSSADKETTKFYIGRLDNAETLLELLNLQQ